MVRMKALSLHWAEYGFGTPKMVHIIDVMKMLVLYMFGGLVIIRSLVPWRAGIWRTRLTRSSHVSAEMIRSTVSSTCN